MADQRGRGAEAGSTRGSRPQSSSDENRGSGLFDWVEYGAWTQSPDSGEPDDSRKAAVTGVVLGLGLDERAEIQLSGSAQRVVESDTEGRFQIDSLNLGQLTLWAKTAHSTSPIEVLDLVEGEDTEVTLTLGPPAGLSGRLLVASAERSGGPAAVAGAAVTLLRPASDERHRTQTDETGRFEFGPLPPDRFQLTLESAAHAIVQARTVVLVAGETTEVNITLEAPAIFSGRVVDESGEGVPEASVSGRPFARPTTTDEGGHFSLISKPGAMWLRIEHEAYTTLSENFTIAPGTTTAEGEYVLRRGATLAGVVTGPGGELLRGAEVRLVSEGWAQGKSHHSRAGPVSTGTDGSFELHNAPEGTHFVGVSAKNMVAAQVGPLTLWSGRVIEDIEIALGAGEVIEGQVVDQNGEAIAGATLLGQIIGSRYFHTRSDGEGRFRATGVHPGIVTMSVQKPGYLKWTDSAVTSPSSNLRIVLDQAGALRGRVIDSQTRAPIRSFKVGRTRVEDSDGYFDVPVLEDEAYWIAISATDYAAQYLGPFVFSGSPIDVGTVALDGGHEVYGLVLDQDGEPLAGATIRSTFGLQGKRKGPYAQYTTATASDGSFVLSGLPAGPWRIHAQGGGLSGSQEVDLPTQSDLLIQLGRHSAQP